MFMQKKACPSGQRLFVTSAEVAFKPYQTQADARTASNTVQTSAQTEARRGQHPQQHPHTSQLPPDTSAFAAAAASQAQQQHASTSSQPQAHQSRTAVDTGAATPVLLYDGSEQEFNGLCTKLKQQHAQLPPDAVYVLAAAAQLGIPEDVLQAVACKMGWYFAGT